ncbi:disulfide bond formation protein B [Pelagibacterium halotolerans]|uniref:disulfide bond formation protein B n=1 Tax=Pelagibacterium halotolerans TaxID=531813 RepID=UPI00384B2A13
MTLHSPQTVGPNRNRANAAFTIGLFTILGALSFQYIGGLYPCELCLTQRWPYYIGLPLLAVVVFAWERVPEPVRIALTAIVGALFVWGTYVAVYHAGVEYGVFEGPQTCTGTGDAAVSLDSLGDMSGAQIVPCDAVQFELFGVSLAGFNAIISAVIVILLTMSIWGQVSRRRAA